MDIDFHDSRLEKEASEWQAKEERLRKLFGSAPSFENSILREKLRWHEDMIVKYKDTSHLEERSVLYLIRSERNNLIKAIYPNAGSRLLYKILNTVLLGKLRNRKLVAEESESKKMLRNTLAAAGFKDVEGKAERYKTLGQVKFTVPVSYYLNEKERMDFSLHFKKDETRHYQFEGFKAALHDSSQMTRDRSHHFTADDPDLLHSKKAYELLSGRAVQTMAGWKQFDFTDKDANDMYRIKEFPKEYGYDIEKAFAQLPLAVEGQTGISSVIHSLKEGGREAVLVEKEGVQRKILIEADPQRKFFTVYDQEIQKVPLSALFENKIPSPEGLQRKPLELKSKQQTDEQKEGRRKGSRRSRGRSIN